MPARSVTRLGPPYIDNRLISSVLHRSPGFRVTEPEEDISERTAAPGFSPARNFERWYRGSPGTPFGKYIRSWASVTLKNDVALPALLAGGRGKGEKASTETMLRCGAARRADRGGCQRGDHGGAPIARETGLLCIGPLTLAGASRTVSPTLSSSWLIFERGSLDIRVCHPRCERERPPASSGTFQPNAGRKKPNENSVGWPNFILIRCLSVQSLLTRHFVHSLQ